MASGGQAKSGGGKVDPAAAKGSDIVEINSELEWIRFREETLGPAAYQEAAGSKFMRKIKENPFVPIGN